MTKVFLIEKHILPNLRKIVSNNIKNKFKEGDVVAVKVHMGEYGNLAYVRPPIIGVVVEELKKIGAKPFLFDTIALYPGQRDSVEKYKETAVKNGFTEETIGCPIVISDEGLKMKSKFFSSVEIAKKMYEANGAVVISHFKGHDLTTFGGAIKNIGMGCVTKKGKGTLHFDTQPEVTESCTGCGICSKVCRQNAISIKDGRAVINYNDCYGCCNCVDACPNKAMKQKTTSLASGLTEVCSIFKNKFGKKMLYVNVLLDITDLCDCYPIGATDAGKVITPDIGVTVSEDMIAVDKASLDLVQKATDNKFGKLIVADPLKQIKAAKEFNLGSDKYEIEVIE